MTINLSPEAEARLREKAERDGQNMNSVADALILSALEWEAREMAEVIEGVRRGDLAAAEGRERPLSTFFSEQRAKYGFSSAWPDVTPGDGDNHGV